jgi:RNA polymerase sigma-70 factor (ECF subfamily)
MEQRRQNLREFEIRLRSFVTSRVSNPSDVDDIIQEAFLRFCSVDKDDAIGNPLGYLYRIALNIIIDRARRRTPLTNSVDIDGVAENFLATGPLQEQGRELADLQRAYHAALAELSPRCAQVFHLRRHRSMTAPDVAARLSITTRMVQKHMVIAMAHLQNRLGPFLHGNHAGLSGEGGGSSVPVRCQMASSSQAHA